MSAMEIPVYAHDGTITDRWVVEEGVFPEKIQKALLHQALVMYLASRRQGTADTKTRSEVRGGGAKPYRQKGTGRARQGSIRAPQFVGGGIVFGPHPRDYGYPLPKRMKRAALRAALHAKCVDQELFGIVRWDAPVEKTKAVAAVFDAIGLRGKILVLADGSHETLLRAGHNLPHVTWMRGDDVNAADVLRHKWIVMTQDAWAIVRRRIVPRRRLAEPVGAA